MLLDGGLEGVLLKRGSRTRGVFGEQVRCLFSMYQTALLYINFGVKLERKFKLGEGRSAKRALLLRP